MQSLAQNYSKTIKKLCLLLGTYELRGIKILEALAQLSSFEFLEKLDLVIQSHFLSIVSNFKDYTFRQFFDCLPFNKG
jgi:hypothetical protein